MPQKPAVSVIVPIYNVEAFLERCLRSIEEQTLKNFNVIMIDDGSEDRSGEIARSFAERDNRFLYEGMSRNGVAKARNRGLELADGEFIAFLDSDDYVEPTYLEELYNAAIENSCMMSSCNYSLNYIDQPGVDHPVKIRKLKTGVYSKEFYVNHIIRDWNVRSYLWNKLWHRSLFFDYDITFPNMYFEDIATVARLAFHTDKVAVVDKPLYHYSVRSNSIMTTTRVEKINDYILSYGIIRNYIEYHGEGKTYRISFLKFALIIYFANYYNVFNLHFVCRNFKGWIKNQHISNKNIIYFARKNFKAVPGYPELPKYIFSPVAKEAFGNTKKNS